MQEYFDFIANVILTGFALIVFGVGIGIFVIIIGAIIDWFKR